MSKMRGLLFLFLILAVLLAGCTESPLRKAFSEVNESNATGPEGQLVETIGSQLPTTSSEIVNEETTVTTETEVNVTTGTKEPKTYYVNIAEGIGVRESSG